MNCIEEVRAVSISLNGRAPGLLVPSTSLGLTVETVILKLLEYAALLQLLKDGWLHRQQGF